MKPAVRNRYRTNLRIVVYRLLLAYKVHHVLNGYRIWKHHGTEVRSGCTAVRACMWNGEKELETRKHNPWSFKSLRRGTPIHRCLKLILIHVTYPLSIIYEGRSPSKDGQRARGWLFNRYRSWILIFRGPHTVVFDGNCYYNLQRTPNIFHRGLIFEGGTWKLTSSRHPPQQWDLDTRWYEQGKLRSSVQLVIPGYPFSKTGRH